MTYSHISVLQQEAIEALLNPQFDKRAGGCAPPNDGVFVDGTFGRGGHSGVLLQRLAKSARLLVFDRDPQAIATASALARADSRIEVIHDGFASLELHLQRLGIARVAGILLDLGVSSPQLDDPSRGFSFMRDGPLDMRMDTTRGVSAAQWLAHADEQHIKEVIAIYGEERFALRIAKAIVARRQSGALDTTGELAKLVAAAVRTREKGQHPATRTFQALRIHINGELAQLAHALPAAINSLQSGGRLAVISFHSLEDRMVKQCLGAAAQPARDKARLPIAERDMPQPLLTLLGRHKASAAEIELNPRARSAVLRAAQRTAEPVSAAQLAALVPAPLLATSGWQEARA